MELLENDYIKYWIDNDILYSEFKVPTKLSGTQAKEMIDMRHKISNGKHQYWCCSFNNIKSYSKEARDYAEVHGQDFLHATAVVVNSHITQYILNIFTKLKKSTIPLKAFKNKEDAIAWLNELKQAQNTFESIKREEEAIK